MAKNKKHKHKARQLSKYEEERKQEMQELLAKAKTPEARQMIKKAFDMNAK